MTNYLNRSVIIDDYDNGLILAVVMFPKPYLVSKAIHFLKFKNLRADLYFYHEKYSLFYQDEKFIPELDEYDRFMRICDSNQIIKYDDNGVIKYSLAKEINYCIVDDNMKKANIILALVEIIR